MIIKKYLWLILVVSYFNITSLALANNSLEQALEIANDNDLELSTNWEILFHYKQSFWGSPYSEIQSGHSFLSRQESFDLKDELTQTIQQLYRQPNSSNNNDHARCRFPARYLFLSEFIDFPLWLKTMQCSDLDAWIRPGDVESISLIFASGYFRNPASFFGHPLLRFNLKSTINSSLLNLTLNNGAVVPENENLVVYMIKGLVGGYQSSFSDTQFYVLNHSYVENDLRDLWEYELNLSIEQIKRFVYFSWELLDQKFEYRFFTHNCSYFLENLIRFALGNRISRHNPLYTIPSTTFHNLMQKKSSQWVKQIKRIPSRQSVFRERFSSLSQREQERIADYVHDISSATDSLNPALGLKEIDVLIDYYTFLEVRAKNTDQKQFYNQRRLEMFRKRLALTDNKQVDWNTAPESRPPHEGNPNTLIRLQSIYNSEFGEGIGIRIRPGSYDLIDLNGTHLENSTLNFFNTELAYINGNVELLNFDIVHISTLNISKTGLPGDGGLGFGLKFGINRLRNDCLDCSKPNVSASVFKGNAMAKDLTVYLQAQAKYHGTYLDENAQLNFQVGIVGHLLKHWKSHLVVGQEVGLNGDMDNRTNLIWQNRIGNNKFNNLVFNLTYNGAKEFNLGYGWYW